MKVSYVSLGFHSWWIHICIDITLLRLKKICYWIHIIHTMSRWCVDSVWIVNSLSQDRKICLKTNVCSSAARKNNLLAHIYICIHIIYIYGPSFNSHSNAREAWTTTFPLYHPIDYIYNYISDQVRRRQKPTDDIYKELKNNFVFKMKTTSWLMHLLVNEFVWPNFMKNNWKIVAEHESKIEKEKQLDRAWYKWTRLK